MSWKSNIATSILSKISNPVLNNRGASKRITILNYHRVLNQGKNFLLDDGVVSVSPELFEEELKFCKKYFTCINFYSLNKYMAGEKFPTNPLILTFDDGYRDSYTHAFPLLKKYNVPATIFLAVDYIGADKIYWWDETCFYLKHLYPTQPQEIKAVLRRLKSIPNSERIIAINQLKSAVGIEVTKYVADRQILNWEEVREMSDNGIEFGSHTMTHPVLTSLANDAELDYELRESKKIIENKIGKKVIVFSYPVGGHNALNEKIIRQVHDVGYDFAVTYLHGVNSLNNAQQKYTLKRVMLDQECFAKFKAKLAFPQLFRR